MNGALLSAAAGVACCGTVAALAAGVVVADAETPETVQPIRFNHKYHVEVVEIECLNCHAGLTMASESRIPTVEKCGECHEDPPEKPGDFSEAANAEMARLREFISKATPLPWRVLFRVPDHVYFSHVRHVDVAKLECTECHPDMPGRTTPPTEARTITMSECIACHERHEDNPSATRAANDCATCHH